MGRFEELRERLRTGPAIAPSILAADFAHLGEEIAAAAAAGAASIHFDVMDGRFVPNLSIGLPVLASVRRVTALPIEAHLMIVEPERYTEAFARAGADIVTVHSEATVHLHRVLTMIRDAGAVPGVTLNPATPLVMIEEILPLVGLVLVMSINPGFGGQTYLPASSARIARLAEMRAERSLDFIIEVDGGINPATIRAAAEAGCDLMVSGSAVFNAQGTVAANVDALRAAMR
ncbi:MAG: ribulose-phosphate 3-epimerase [Thermomicrobia bacterium]|nr:ribulose-phosphate 3-epimerase [Thermomicrobia bacterium]MCA1723123.1 ribulose-phosphate 3-epimerase [Thermomicrobia bacterium]